jgi:hypothetical protein
MAIAITLNRLLCVGTGLLLIAGGYGCDDLSRGNSSDGAYSRVDQVSTGKNSFAFTETWYKKGPKPIKTSGSGRFEASNNTNIYIYSKPKGVVVVRTEESPDEISTVDTVINTTIPLFKVGEQITYTVRE